MQEIHENASYAYGISLNGYRILHHAIYRYATALGKITDLFDAAANEYRQFNVLEMARLD
jgi:hypothetical protein